MTQHKFDCGIDLHVAWMYCCGIDADGEVRMHQNIRTSPKAFLQALPPFREDVVVGVECLFTWYGLADLCKEEGRPFVLGHALDRRAIHGGTAKHDRLDSHKMAALRPHASGVRFPAPDACHARSLTPPPSAHAQAGRVVGAHPAYRQPG
jgi:hypothetical protein